MSLLDFNSWISINETVAFDPDAKYPDQTFGFTIGTVDSGKANVGGDGGNWGGSMPRALWFGRVATDFMKANYPDVFKSREVVTSQKRTRKDTASGNISDHYEGNLVAYAVDLSVAGDAQKSADAKARGNALLAHIMELVGHPEYTGGSWFNFTTGGYRYQVGWLVANHYDHIHVGVEKTSVPDSSTAGTTTASTTTSLLIAGSTFAERLYNNPMFKSWAMMTIADNPDTFKLKDVEYALQRSGAKEWFMKTFGLNSEGYPIELGGNSSTTTSTGVTPPTSVSTGVITKNDTDFDNIVATVIDKLEGGYFHPNMRTKNPTKFGSYHRSGETMFGLDRHAGHDLYYSTDRKSDDVLTNLAHIESGEYEYASPEAKEFWETIDAADAKNTWEWGYRGGSLETRLTYLAGRIIKQRFDSLASKYLTEEAQKIVNSDGRILFNFIYATWNGPGWFQKWATDFNKMVESGETNTDTLLNSIVGKRETEGLSVGSGANSLISKGAKKIKEIVGLA